jgi:hypothetical protein
MRGNSLWRVSLPTTSITGPYGPATSSRGAIEEVAVAKVIAFYVSNTYGNRRRVFLSSTAERYQIVPTDEQIRCPWRVAMNLIEVSNLENHCADF